MWGMLDDALHAGQWDRRARPEQTGEGRRSVELALRAVYGVDWSGAGPTAAPTEARDALRMRPTDVRARGNPGARDAGAAVELPGTSEVDTRVARLRACAGEGGLEGFVGRG